MAEITFNPIIESAHGKLGKLVLRRTPSGKTTIIKLADMSGVTWSEAQREHRQRFKEANAYAKAAMADATSARLYKAMARELGKRPYHLAVADYFKGRNLLSKRDNQSD